MEKRLPIEDRFTLPEGRKACRLRDFKVSTKEYERLRDLEETYPDLASASVDPDELRGNIATVHILGDVGEALKKIKVKRGQGDKAAKASSLREHDLIIGYRGRIDPISDEIVDAIIAEFRGHYTALNFLHNVTPSKDRSLAIDGIKVPPMGWADDKEESVISSLDEDSRTTKGDSRWDFLYHLQRSVETRVNNEMMELLKVEFNDESIWDSLRVIVDLIKRECDGPRHVNADVFFAGIEKGGE